MFNGYLHLNIANKFNLISFHMMCGSVSGVRVSTLCIQL